MQFTVVLDYDPQEDVYNVSVPSLPGCFTWGKTKAEALRNAKDAIEVFIDVLAEYGDPIPEEVELHRIKIG